MPLTISLEPPALGVDDAAEQSLFAPPARLVDLDLATGEQIISRDDPDEGVGARLRRLWQERGDFSALTAQTIRDGPGKEEGKPDEAGDDDARPTGQDIRELSSQLLEQLHFARTELTTALDLLSVISKPTDPPSVDVDSLPLPQETLTLVPTAPPPAASTDPAENPLASLPLALSLSSIHKSASAFFAAADQMLPSSDDAPEASTSTGRIPSAWPTLLALHSQSAHTLLPLGAQRGAALSGKGENKSAREVGIFYGAEEAALPFRRAAVARVSDLRQEGGKGKAAPFAGRKMVLRLEMDDQMGESVWGGEEWVEGHGGDEAVLSGLKERGRAAFAEELFTALSTEARNESSLKARLNLGKRSAGDSITLNGHNWTLTLTMVHTPPPPPPPPTSAASDLPSLLLPLLRLLFIQEYRNRRLAHIASQPSSPHSGGAWSRPILASLTVLLGYVQRGKRVRNVLDEVARAAGDGGQVEFEGGSVEDGVWFLLQGRRELGARAVLRVGKSPQRVFHVSYSLPLPYAPHGAFTSSSATVVPPPAAVAAPATTLVLQAPGRGPIQIPSVEHLKLFLTEQVSA